MQISDLYGMDFRPMGTALRPDAVAIFARALGEIPNMSLKAQVGRQQQASDAKRLACELRSRQEVAARAKAPANLPVRGTTSPAIRAEQRAAAHRAEYLRLISQS